MASRTHSSLAPLFRLGNPAATTASVDPPESRGFTRWLHEVAPDWTWDWPHLTSIRTHLARVTRGEIDRLGIMLPPQHGKSRSVTVPYPAWRMLREPGLRCGVCSHSQRYADKLSRWVKKFAVRAGGVVGSVNRADEWELTNGSTFIARGRGASIAGEPLDLLLVDDVFGTRQDADSPTVQEAAHEWYMDDVTPRLQKTAPIILVNTRWGPGDLYGRIQAAEEGSEWTIVRMSAISETQEERDRVNAIYGLAPGLPDPIGRAPGVALCEDRFPLEKLLQKRRIEGVGFESLYQGNPIPRGGTFFERAWFEVVKAVPWQPPLTIRRVRYWDLAASRQDSACFTAGILIAKIGEGEQARYFVEDVVRGQWMPAERNEVMLQTARADETLPGFERTYFEEPVFDKDRAASRAIIAKLAGLRVSPDRVSGQGSKEIRAEPVAGAAKAGLVKIVAGNWNGAFLTEVESFPRGQYKDQVDSLSAGYSKLSRPRGKVGVMEMG